MNNQKLICNAYFINKVGEIIPVKSRHIVTVVDSPSKFELTKKQIVMEYIKSGETIGSEGRARNILILRLLKKGFVRIRYFRASTLWRIQIHSELTKKLKKNILSFCRQLESGEVTDISQHQINVDVEIHDTVEQRLFKGSLSDTIAYMS